MCGIAGCVDWNKDIKKYKDIIEEMKDVQIHRGPDEGDEWITNNVCLLHRRLIVIDPEGGKQPMVREINGCKYVIVYNGELYNTSEIRKRLRNKGYSFQGYSDTEVLLMAYIHWGEKCPEYLNGIFAFAIWDQAKEKLFMARDRIGVKPLFYSVINGGLVFASEIKALLAHPEIEAKIDKKGLAEIFIMSPARTPGNGIFLGVKELKPGMYLSFDKKGIIAKKYWSLKSKPHTDSLSITVQKIRELFIDIVNRQLISDVPICTLLSGGLDSSAITAIASNIIKKENKGQLHTYSVDYKGNKEHFTANNYQPDSDNKWIKMVSDYADTKHHYVMLSTEELVDNLKNGVYARDLPGMADIDVSLYLFCKEINKRFIVAVSGECADEIFGGYPWFYREEALNDHMFPWLRRIETRIKILNTDLQKEICPYQYLKQRYEESLGEVPQLPGEDEENKKMREMFYLNLTRWMPILLDRKDRMSMFTGLEVRVPFCDHRLVEYVWNIPWKMKNYNNYRKGILREALRGLLPEKVRIRPKNPYPKTFNPKYFQATRKELKNILNNKRSPLLDFINIKEINKLIELKQDFNIPWFGQLMRLPQLFAYLIQVNIWLKEYNVKINF